MENEEDSQILLLLALDRSFLSQILLILQTEGCSNNHNLAQQNDLSYKLEKKKKGRKERKKMGELVENGNYSVTNRKRKKDWRDEERMIGEIEEYTGKGKREENAD